jgi:CBS domain-containing protein
MLVSTILHEKGDTVVAIAPGATVAEAVALLNRHNIGAVVVTSDGRSIDGILSERDIVRALEGHEAVLDKPVSELMTAAVMTCDPCDTVDALMATMTERRIRHLPVVDQGALSGIVSIGDVVRHRVDELQLEAKTLHDYLVTGR